MGKRCQVHGCRRELPTKHYYQRYKICHHHQSLPSLAIDGVVKRWCQQCGRFHQLDAFDGERKTCRAKLNHHNRRRQMARRSAGRGEGAGADTGDAPQPAVSPSVENLYEAGTANGGDSEPGSEPTGPMQEAPAGTAAQCLARPGPQGAARAPGPGPGSRPAQQQQHERGVGELEIARPLGLPRPLPPPRAAQPARPLREPGQQQQLGPSPPAAGPASPAWLPCQQELAQLPRGEPASPTARQPPPGSPPRSPVLVVRAPPLRIKLRLPGGHAAPAEHAFGQQQPPQQQQQQQQQQQAEQHAHAGQQLQAQRVPAGQLPLPAAAAIARTEPLAVAGAEDLLPALELGSGQSRGRWQADDLAATPVAQAQLGGGSAAPFSAAAPALAGPADALAAPASPAIGGSTSAMWPHASEATPTSTHPPSLLASPGGTLGSILDALSGTPPDRLWSPLEPESRLWLSPLELQRQWAGQPSGALPLFGPLQGAGGRGAAASGSGPSRQDGQRGGD